MYRNYAYPIDVEWRTAPQGQRQSPPRPSDLREGSVEGTYPRLATAPAYAIPHKRPLF